MTSAVETLGLAYYLTAHQAYAEHATRLLRVWFLAVGMLGTSPAWTGADQEGLEAWFRQSLAWLRESKHGRDEDRTTNNHATWFDASRSF